MAHEVKFYIPGRRLGREDIVFDVDQDGAHLGEFKVSKGAVVWIPSNAKTQFTIEWERFGALMEEHGRRSPTGPRRRKAPR